MALHAKMASISAPRENQLAACRLIAERVRYRQHFRGYSRPARAGTGLDRARPRARLRMPARTDRSSVSCLDPGGADHRFDAGAGADAVVAFLLSRIVRRLGGVLDAGAAARLA